MNKKLNVMMTAFITGFILFTNYCYATPVSVGQPYGGGTVFCVSQTPDTSKCVTQGSGEYGLIMANVDQANLDSPNKGVHWSSESKETGALSDDDGLANTQTILAAHPKDNPGNNAAHLAKSYRDAEGQAGKNLSQWYLPSKNELNKMYLYGKASGLIGKNCAGSRAGGVQCLIGGYDEYCRYWSSTEYSGFGYNAWLQNFSNGGQYNNYKVGYYRGVRVVRAFNNSTIQPFNDFPKAEISKGGVGVSDKEKAHSSSATTSDSATATSSAPISTSTHKLAVGGAVDKDLPSKKADSSSAPTSDSTPNANRFTFGSADENLEHLGELPQIYPPNYQPPPLAEALAKAGVEDPEDVSADCDIVAQCAEHNGAMVGTGLTGEGAASIAAYTYDTGDNRSPYRLINTALFERNMRQLGRLRGLLYRLLYALRALPPTQATILYRGIRARVNLDHAHYHRGNTITWHPFSSTTTDMQTTQNFLTDQTTRRCEGTLFIIRGNPWGYNVQPFSCFPDEEEILLEPEIDLRVTGVIDGAMIVIELEMVPDQRLLLERLIPRRVIVIVTLDPAAGLLQIAQNPGTSLTQLNAVVGNQNVNAQVLAAVAAHRNADANTLLTIVRNNITNIVGLTAIVRNPNVNNEILWVVHDHQNIDVSLRDEVRRRIMQPSITPGAGAGGATLGGAKS